MVRDEEVGTSKMGGMTPHDSEPQANGDINQVLSQIEGSASISSRH